MQELTEREQKLLEIVKKFINVNTIYGLYQNSFAELSKWKHDALDAAGFSLKWQDEILHTLESEFGLKFNIIDSHGKPKEETNGDKNEEREV